VAGLTDATFSVSDFLSSMIWSTCEFRPNIVESVKETLNKVIKGQDEGVSMILNALHAWEFQRTLGIHQPMVIAITGSTGVGKTETSYQIANALFPTRKYSDSVVKPCGYLALRGEDYSNSSELFRHGISHVGN
jgi:Cdc6-like AAA superfamily ATPase